MTQELKLATASERILAEKKKESNLKVMVYPIAEQSQQWPDACAPLISGWPVTAGEDRRLLAFCVSTIHDIHLF
jgi:hypothetical protein